MAVHVVDPRRLAGLVLIILLIVALVLLVSSLTSPEPVPIGRS